MTEAIREGNLQHQALLKVQVEIDQQIDRLDELQTKLEDLQLDQVDPSFLGLLRQGAMDCAMSMESIDYLSSDQFDTVPNSGNTANKGDKEEDEALSDDDKILKHNNIQQVKSDIAEFFKHLSCSSIAFSYLRDALIKYADEHLEKNHEELIEHNFTHLNQILQWILLVDAWQMEKNQTQSLLREVDHAIARARNGIKNPYTVLQKAKAHIEKERLEGETPDKDYLEGADQLDEILKQVVIRSQILERLQNSWREAIEEKIGVIAKKIARLQDSSEESAEGGS